MSDAAAPTADRFTTLWAGRTALAVDKPSGMLVHNSGFSGAKERSLRQEVGTVLGRRVFPVHRLDRGTSGVLFFAREREWVQPWQDALAQADAAKLYLALVRGRPAKTLRWSSRPVKDAHGERRPALSAILPVSALPELRCALVALRLFTGRHHQARRHLNGIGHPVVNDSAHGDTRFNRAFREASGFSRLALHAARLRVVAPAIEQGDAPTLSLDAPWHPPLDAALRAAGAAPGQLDTDVSAAFERLLALRQDDAPVD